MSEGVLEGGLESIRGCVLEGWGGVWSPSSTAIMPPVEVPQMMSNISKGCGSVA